MKETGNSIPELYGSLVFNDKVMRERLPKDTYKALRKTIENGTHLELDVANTGAIRSGRPDPNNILLRCTRGITSERTCRRSNNPYIESIGHTARII